jgi:hypothetical protein
VAEKLRAEESQSQARQAIRRLIGGMELSGEDMVGLPGVPTGIVREWESSETTVPTEMRATLTRADNALSRLLAIFRPERLPQVIRQKAGLFQGASARDWIRHGRIQEVADLYEAAFATRDDGNGCARARADFPRCSAGLAGRSIICDLFSSIGGSGAAQDS